MSQLILTLAIGCFFSCVAWLLLFFALHLFLVFVVQSGGFVPISFTTGYAEIISVVKIAVVVGLVHGIFISLGFFAFKPESLLSGLTTGFAATEALLYLFLLIFGAYVLNISNAKISISSIGQLGYNGVIYFLILTIVFFIPTVAIVSGLWKVVGVASSNK